MIQNGARLGKLRILAVESAARGIHVEYTLHQRRFFRLIVIAPVVHRHVHEHRRDAEETVGVEIPFKHSVGFFRAVVDVEFTEGDVFLYFGIAVVNAQVGIPLGAGIGRVTDRCFIAVAGEKQRHDLQRLILFFLNGKLGALIHFLGDVFVAAVESRRADERSGTVGNGVGIVGEAGKLSLDLRFFLDDVGEEIGYSAVKHEDYHILAVFV